MTTDQWVRVRALFEAAVDARPSDAAALIAREAADDPDVRAEVQSLLDHHTRAGEFLSQPAVERLPDLLVDAPALAPGATIGPYTIERELGRGGMGRVYLARDARLGRTVALKALAPHLVEDANQRERLRREARAAARLGHPGICTVYALEEIEGELFIASEYVDGETLGDEIRRGHRPTAVQLTSTAHEIAAALASAHAAGVVHRDLKPDNVMRSRDGRLKILDFGLARVLDPQAPGGTLITQPGLLIGTPAYMAPEQINGEPADARADVFAFGVLLYEYASGVHPFVAATPLATAARVLESEARPVVAHCPDAPPAVAALITRCLRKAPGERFASAREIVAALDVASDAARPAAPHASAAWWRVHQVVLIALYAVGAAFAWQMKEWRETPITVAVFIALGAAATAGGVFRGHLVFTERFNRSHLATERRRSERATTMVDLMFAALLLADGLLLAGVRALASVVAVSLSAAIALGAVILEPATRAAAFGDADDRDRNP